MKTLATKNISIRLDKSLLNIIDDFAKSKNISRAKAITIMLRSTHITIIPNGAELSKALFRIQSLLSHTNITTFAENEIRKEIKQIWLLLDSTTENAQQTTKK